MRPPSRTNRLSKWVAYSALCALLVSGCKTSSKVAGPSGSTFGTGPDGNPAYRSTDHFEKIWLAEGFTFNGYDRLLIGELDSTGITPRDDKEAMRLKVLKRAYPNDLAMAFEETETFPFVFSSEKLASGEGRLLVLDSTLLEFNRGSSSARYIWGFGAGMPYLRIQGTFHAFGSEEPLARFEIDEKGDWFGSGFESNSDLQNEATMALGRDLAEYVAQVAAGKPIKYGKAK